MKKILILLIAAMFLTGLAHAETARDPDWTLPETVAMTDEVTEIFTKAMEGLVGVNYEPIGLLAEKEGTCCILCRATVVYPGAAPGYSLVYVNEEGLVNIWDLWIDAHANKPAAENVTEEAAEEATEEAEAEEPAEEADVQYVLYLGTNDKDTNKPVFTQAEALEQAKAILIRHFGGYTIQEASGGWIDEGKEYQEYTLVIYLSDTTLDQVHAAADEMVETFRQSSVLIQANPTKTEFYSPEN